MAAAAQMKIKSYLEKHKIGNLFEELYGHLLQDQPDDPLLYLTRKLQRKVDQRKPRSSSPTRSKAISATMPAQAVTSSTDATAENPDKPENVKLTTANKVKSKRSSSPPPSRSVAFAATPATAQSPPVAPQPQAEVKALATAPAVLQAPIVIKADQPAMDPLDRELKPSANDGDNSDNSDLDDRLARMREEKLSRGKKASSAKEARKRELAELLAKSTDVNKPVPMAQASPNGPAASIEQEENFEELEKELGVQSVKKTPKPKKPKKEKKPDVQVRVALCARCASIIPDGDGANGSNGMRPPLWLSGDLIDDDIDSASLLEGSRSAGGNNVLTRRIPSASASPRSSSLAMGQRPESGNGSGLLRSLASSNGRPASSGSAVAGPGGSEGVEGTENVGTSYAWQTVADSDTESVSGSRGRSRAGTGSGGSRPPTSGNTGRF